MVTQLELLQDDTQAAAAALGVTVESFESVAHVQTVAPASPLPPSSQSPLPPSEPASEGDTARSLLREAMGVAGKGARQAARPRGEGKAQGKGAGTDRGEAEEIDELRRLLGRAPRMPQSYVGDNALAIQVE